MREWLKWLWRQLKRLYDRGEALGPYMLIVAVLQCVSEMKRLQVSVCPLPSAPPPNPPPFPSICSAFNR